MRAFFAAFINASFICVFYLAFLSAHFIGGGVTVHSILWHAQTSKFCDDLLF
jgi:hypothetical protein